MAVHLRLKMLLGNRTVDPHHVDHWTWLIPTRNTSD